MNYTEFVSDPIFAQFATIDPIRQSLIQQFLSDSECEEPIDQWLTDCNLRERAIKYLAAHQITVHDRMVNSGGLASPGIPSSISVSTGSQSISFKLPTAEDIRSGGNYTDTNWGVQYLRLKQKGKIAWVGRVV